MKSSKHSASSESFKLSELSDEQLAAAELELEKDLRTQLAKESLVQYVRSERPPHYLRAVVSSRIATAAAFKARRLRRKEACQRRTPRVGLIAAA